MSILLFGGGDGVGI